MNMVWARSTVSTRGMVTARHSWFGGNPSNVSGRHILIRLSSKKADLREIPQGMFHGTAVFVSRET
jgi:hypothetical protein